MVGLADEAKTRLSSISVANAFKLISGSSNLSRNNMVIASQSNFQDDDQVLELINEIAKKTAAGEFIYRGEPEHYEKVSSSLFRQYSNNHGEDFDIETVQKERLKDAKKHTGPADDYEILTSLQHFGGATNLIDFTNDWNIALFFACNAAHDRDGRVILLLRRDDETEFCIREPWSPRNRVIAQNSVFVQPKRGFVKPDGEINIPKELKHSILAYLQKNHGIVKEKIYNDLHGYIQLNAQSHETSLLSVRLSSRQRELCEKMDELYALYRLQAKPSDMFMGAMFALRNASNPERIAQAAHSLREIFYPLFGSDFRVARDNKRDKKEQVFLEYGSALIDKILADKIGRVYGDLTNLAHHNSAPLTRTDFEALLTSFEEYLGQALTRQLDFHREIDQLLSGYPPSENNESMIVHVPHSVDKERIQKLIYTNLDARRYFYAKADERWLDWLWEIGFLDPIKKEDPTLNGYRPPELDYLVRMAEICPAKVVNIMLDVPISTDSRSQQAAYQFLRICRMLPPNQLAHVVKKIRSERWVPLLAKEDRSVFAFEEMLKKLAAAEDYRGMVALTGAVLAVRSKDELADQHFYVKSPFYFDHLLVTGVFERLAAIDPEYAEDAFALVTEVMAEVVLLGAQKDDRDREPLSNLDSLEQRIHSLKSDTTVFEVHDSFSLLKVDFFELEPGKGKLPSHQRDVRELVAVVKILADRLIGEEGADQNSVRKIYDTYVETLPDSSVTWRFRLYVWSLRPQVFGKELRSAFFRLFEVARPHEIMRWREFQKSLRNGFPFMSVEDRRNFVQSIIEMYSQGADYEKDSGSNILSPILPFLRENPDLEEQATTTGFQLDPEYEPQPVTSDVGEFREVIPQAPITTEEFGQLTITEIATKLRKEWTPEKLYELKLVDDTYAPLNASGVGNLIKNDMPSRLQQYIDGAQQFFDRGLLDPHYTYEYLSGIEKTIRDHRDTASEANWDGVIDLLEEIRASGENTSFARGGSKFDDFWHAGWDAVHLVATDVLHDLFAERDGQVLIQLGKYREQSLKTISYLLTHPQPSPEDEKDEMPQGALDLRARKRDPENRWLTDPFSRAIQTVRGRAFETLVLFSERDGLHLRDDVKQVYQRTIQEEATRALMSMVGRFLPVFYFRDMDWIRKFLPHIFSHEPERKYLTTSAWEGYLTNGLYREMFIDSEIQSLYWRGLDITDDDYPRHQMHVTNPHEGIAEHLALALMYCNEEFGFDHPLFKAFWDKDNSKQHAHFVSFLGQEFVFRSNMHDFFKNHPEGKQRLRDFWVWIIKNHNNPETFREFGLWINLKKEIFEPAWLAQRVKETLEKSEGVLNSENDLRESSVQLAHEAPEDTLKIAQLHLLEGGVRGGKKQTVMRWDLEEMWIEAFKILYRNPATKGGTGTLINLLVLEGGQRFWPLGEIVKTN